MVPGPGQHTGSSPFWQRRTSLGRKRVSCAVQGDFLVKGVCVEAYDSQEEHGVLCLFDEEDNR